MPATRMTVGGVFSSPDEAGRAVEGLKRAGFAEADVGAVPGEVLGVRSETGVTAETGAAVGGMTGAALGGLAGGPVGMLAGAVAGGLLGALIDLGIPEDSAAFYRDEQQAGRTVVFVRTERGDEAADLLRRQGAKDVRVTTGAP